MNDKLFYSYPIFIAATPQQVWDALTRPELQVGYFPNGEVHSDWQPGSDCTWTAADGDTVVSEGKVLEADRPRSLVQTINNSRVAHLAGHQEMTIGWYIEQKGDACKLTVTHEGSDSDAAVFELLTSHCPHTLSGIKSLLETGRRLTITEPATREAVSAEG